MKLMIIGSNEFSVISVYSTSDWYYPLLLDFPPSEVVLRSLEL